MRMIDLSHNQRAGGPLYVIDTPTSVDCSRQLRLRRSLRSFMECMAPYCCSLQSSPSSSSSLDASADSDSDISSVAASSAASSTVTGTFFGYRKGRVNFCIQESSKSHPLLLLEFAVPTSYLAKEMQHGLLRIALECDRAGRDGSGPGPGLFGVPVWTMYCNGRRVGFALKRQMNERDLVVFRTMQSVSVGAGVLPHDGDLLYLRARFERVIGVGGFGVVSYAEPGRELWAGAQHLLVEIILGKGRGIDIIDLIRVMLIRGDIN